MEASSALTFAETNPIHLASRVVDEPSKAEFDDYAQRYREAVQDSISFARTDHDVFTAAKAEALLELIQSRIGSPNRLEVLDVGCGPGETDGFLKGEVGRLAGVDVAQRALDVARAENPEVEYRAYEAGSPLPFADGTFDVAFAVCVFHHVPVAERPALVEEMKRVCRPGGLVVLFEHNPYNPLTQRAVHGCEFDAGVELLSRREASGLLRNAGLDPVGRYILFFTRRSRRLRAMERRLHWLPLGAQYVVFAQRT